MNAAGMDGRRSPRRNIGVSREARRRFDACVQSRCRFEASPSDYESAQALRLEPPGPLGPGTVSAFACCHLQELAVDELKLDKSFVMRMTQDRGAAAIVRTTSTWPTPWA